MGIISRGDTPDRKRPGTTVIAAGTQLVGDLTLTDSLHVDGNIEGKIESNGEVSIGVDGRINGELLAQAVMISGQFDGSIEAQRLEIVSTGSVAGSISVQQLVIESGARFNGTSEIKSLPGVDEPPARITNESEQTASGDLTELKSVSKKS